MSSAVIARTTAEQVRHVRDLRADQARQQAHRRALRRCEDLAELLGALSAPQEPRRAARLRAAARLAARDLHRTVVGPHPCPLAPRQGDWSLTPSALDALVEQLDAALCATHAGHRGAHRRALRLAAAVAAGVEALSPEPPAMTAVSHDPGPAIRGLGELHHRLAGLQLDLERLLHRLDGDGDLHAPLAAVAGRLHDLGDALLDTWTALGETRSRWQCPSCRQGNDARFDVCGNCDRRRPRPPHPPATGTLLAELPAGQRAPGSPPR